MQEEPLSASGDSTSVSRPADAKAGLLFQK